MTPLQVDKLWSIVPAAYVWHFALHDRLAPGQGGAPLSPRLVVMGALATAWAVRLTFNFARKGGYRMSAEDYRWPYIRERLHWFPFMLFNLSFISLYQSLLLLSLAAPAYVAWQNTGTPLNAVDAAAAALCAFFISYEAIADQQQWNFQVGEAAGSSSSSGWQRRRQHQGMPAAAPAGAGCSGGSSRWQQQWQTAAVGGSCSGSSSGSSSGWLQQQQQQWARQADKPAVIRRLHGNTPHRPLMQTAKHAKLAAGKRLTAEQARGFLTAGLFRYSRHPNFWAEQCLWWSMYLFGVGASGEPALPATALPATALTYSCACTRRASTSNPAELLS